MKKMLPLAIIVLLSVGFALTSVRETRADTPLVIIENSSTDLTINGNPIAATSQNHWSFGFTAPPPPSGYTFGEISLGSRNWSWIEPDNSTMVNRFTFQRSGPNLSADIVSDTPLLASDSKVADGQTRLILNWEYLPNDPNQPVLHGSQDAQFTDKGDAVGVPEPTALFLLASGLLALAGYGRKKFFKK